jgi:hypothetical protein
LHWLWYQDNICHRKLVEKIFLSLNFLKKFVFKQHYFSQECLIGITKWNCLDLDFSLWEDSKSLIQFLYLINLK